MTPHLLHRKSMALLLALAMTLVVAPARAVAQANNANERAAPQVSVTARAPSSRYAGDAIPIEIVVQGSKNAQVPQFPAIPGVRAEYRGTQDRSSSFTMVVNGQVSSRNTIEQALIFELYPAKQGVITIPPIAVDVDGRTYTTQALAVQVIEPTADPDFKLEIALQTVDAYVGQPVPITLKWTIGKEIRGTRFSFGVPPDFELVSPPDPRQQSLSRRAPQNPRYPEIELNGQRVVAEIAKSEANGRPVETLTIRQILVPRREGRWTLGPARVDYEAVVGQRERRFMDAPWDDRAIIERQRSESAPITMNVRPLPLTGRPADFSGLVGRFSLLASATPTDVSVGEPIDVRVSVTGPHPLTAVPPLDLTTQWSEMASGRRLRLPRDPILATISPGSAVFDAQVRVRNPDVQSLPPVTLNYFDPTDSQYKVAASAPIALTVRPPQGRLIGGEDDPLADDDSSGDEASSLADAKKPRMPDGLAAFDTRPLASRTIAAARLDRLTLKDAALLALAPCGILALAYLARSLTQAWQPRSHTARMKRAFRSAERSVRLASTDDQRAAAIKAYLVTALDLPPQSTTPREAWATATEHLDTATSRDLLRALSPQDWAYAPAQEHQREASAPGGAWQSSHDAQMGNGAHTAHNGVDHLQLLARVHAALTHAASATDTRRAARSTPPREALA